MKILIFTSEQESIDHLSLLDKFSDKTPANDLTEIFKHTTENKWWFNRENCEGDGHVEPNKALMNNWITNLECTELEKTKKEIIDEGYHSG